MSTVMKPRYLVMVTKSNNNKYYRQVPHGDTWTAEYGRVGAAPQTAEYPMSQWDKKYNEKIKKGYVDQTSLIEDLIEKEEPKDAAAYKEIENKAIAEIVERLQEMANDAIRANYRVSSNKVTQAMVDEAQDILTELVSITSVSEFNDTLLKLFTTIPRRMSNVSSYLSDDPMQFAKIIKREQDLLDVMKGQVVQKAVINENHPASASASANVTILEALGLEFEECSKDDIKIIKGALGESKDRFYRAWKVTNRKTRDRFEKFVSDEQIQEVKYLWHGSRNENWWSIINTGLVLRPTNAVINGKMFGYGCYFAPRAQKSIGYTSSGYWTGGVSNTSFMGLMEVAYGKPYDVYSFDPKYYDFNYERLQKACPGANCLHAHAGSMLRNDEIIVYKEDQITIKYLVEIK